MVDAPERIFVRGSEYHSLREQRVNEPHLDNPVEYIRADIVKALLNSSEWKHVIEDDGSVYLNPPSNWLAIEMNKEYNKNED